MIIMIITILIAVNNIVLDYYTLIIAVSVVLKLFSCLQLASLDGKVVIEFKYSDVSVGGFSI